MHILIIHQAFASLDEPGGTRHYEFAQLLARHGHQVTVIASPVSYITGNVSVAQHPTDEIRTEALEAASGGGQQPGSVVILRSPVYAAHHKSFLHRVLAFLSFMATSFWTGLWVKDVDIVWGTSPPIFQGVTAWALARLKHARFLFEVRDLWPQFAVAVGVLKNPALIRAAEWVERFLYRRSDLLVVNSPGFMSHVSSRGARQVQLLPNGADPSMFDPSNDGKEFRRTNGLENQYVALYAGAHGMSNDLDVVLDAANLLTGRNVQLVLLGDGKEKPALQRHAAQLGLKNITFVSSVPKTAMPEALAAADACIAILKPLEEYKTTYPNKVFDYMAAGRPVILAIDGVIREVVEAAGCGVFAEPGNPKALADAISRLADDPVQSRKMGLAGRKYLEEHFSREQVGAELIKALDALYSERR